MGVLQKLAAFYIIANRKFRALGPGFRNSMPGSCTVTQQELLPASPPSSAADCLEGWAGVSLGFCQHRHSLTL